MGFILFSTGLRAQYSDLKNSSENIIYQTLTPEKLPSTTPLKNPGIGIEQASLLETRTNKTEPSYSGEVGPRNNSLDGIATIRYIRSDWVSLEPEDGEYSWITLDNNINNAWNNGQQIGFSFNAASPLISPTYWQMVPAWFIEDPRHVKCTGPNTPEGCTYYEVNFTRCSSFADADCENNWVVNFDDSVYVQAMLDLVEAIRLKYDNEEWAQKWAYLDMRSWGIWGEWFTDVARISGTSTDWPEPSDENKKKFIDSYLKFEHIPVIANYHDQYSWEYAMEKGIEQGKMVGWRTDGIDVTAYIINPAIENNEAIRNGWKHGPVTGEIMGGSLTADQIKNTVLPRANLWNMSGFNNKWDKKYSSDANYKAEIDKWRATGGYRLFVDEVTIPQQVPQNENFDITVKIGNSGTAPLYRRFYNLSLKLSPVEGGKDTVILLNGNLTDILPNETGTFTGQCLAELDLGKYNVFVGITGDPNFDPLPPAVSLANTANEPTGSVHWTKVGDMYVGTIPVSVRNIERINEDVFKGQVSIYTTHGILIKTLPVNVNFKEWLKSENTITPGIYILTDHRVSKIYCVGMTTN